MFKAPSPLRRCRGQEGIRLTLKQLELFTTSFSHDDEHGINHIDGGRDTHRVPPAAHAMAIRRRVCCEYIFTHASQQPQHLSGLGSIVRGKHGRQCPELSSTSSDELVVSSCLCNPVHSSRSDICVSSSIFGSPDCPRCELFAADILLSFVRDPCLASTSENNESLTSPPDSIRSSFRSPTRLSSSHLNAYRLLAAARRSHI